MSDELNSNEQGRHARAFAGIHDLNVERHGKKSSMPEDGHDVVEQGALSLPFAWGGIRGVSLGVALALIASPAIAASPPGASSCSGCHGGNTSVPPIDGTPANDIAAAMAAFRSSERAATVMGRIAKGFSEDETRAIAEWIAARKNEPAK